MFEKVEDLYGFGRRCFKIIDVYKNIEPCFKVHTINMVCVQPKSIKLCQMTNSNVILHVVE